MPHFEVRTNGERFAHCTEQYFLFRRVRELRGLTFRITVGAEIALGAAALALAVLERKAPLMTAFFLAAAALLVWHVTGELQGRDTRNFIQKARQQRLTPEDAAKELVISFDDRGCTLSAPGATLPGKDVESRNIFDYAAVGGLFVSEEYMLVASRKAGSVCFPTAGLVEGTAAELTAFLEQRCNRKAVVCRLNTEKLQALLK